MRSRPLTITGAFVVEPEPIEDERGFFALMWSTGEASRLGLNPRLEQASLSYNRLAGTVRGMHYQAAPHEEAKLVRCQVGSIYDVVLDLRRESPTYLRWEGVEISAADRRMVYVPEGCAHGFQTLTDGAEVFYLLSRAYAPASARGVRWDDPAFGLRWPRRVTSISERDLAFADWS